MKTDCGEEDLYPKTNQTCTPPPIGTWNRDGRVDDRKFPLI
jgi:hypothetical protein